MADLHHPGDRRHRQASGEGGADRAVALAPQTLGLLGQLALALGVVGGEGGQLALGVGGLALGAGDALSSEVFLLVG